MCDKEALIDIGRRCVRFELSAADCEPISAYGIWRPARQINGTRRHRQRCAHNEERGKRRDIRDGPKDVTLLSFLLSNV